MFTLIQYRDRQGAAVRNEHDAYVRTLIQDGPHGGRYKDDCFVFHI